MGVGGSVDRLRPCGGRVRSRLRAPAHAVRRIGGADRAVWRAPRRLCGARPLAGVPHLRRRGGIAPGSRRPRRGRFACRPALRAGSGRLHTDGRARGSTHSRRAESRRGGPRSRSPPAPFRGRSASGRGRRRGALPGLGGRRGPRLSGGVGRTRRSDRRARPVAAAARRRAGPGRPGRRALGVGRCVGRLDGRRQGGARRGPRARRASGRGRQDHAALAGRRSARGRRARSGLRGVPRAARLRRHRGVPVSTAVPAGHDEVAG